MARYEPPPDKVERLTERVLLLMLQNRCVCVAKEENEHGNSPFLLPSLNLFYFALKLFSSVDCTTTVTRYTDGGLKQLPPLRDSQRALMGRHEMEGKKKGKLKEGDMLELTPS